MTTVAPIELAGVAGRTPPDSSFADPQAQQVSDSVDRTCRYLTDGERELRIAQHVSMARHFFGEWDVHGNFSDRGAAERHVMLAADLIAGRSPEQIARLQSMGRPA